MQRGETLESHLSLWQREEKNTTPNNILRVHFSGEDGIDSGAMAKEFLDRATTEIACSMFPNGAPVDSMLNVHNGKFKTCGQIVAVSIVQGGPPPRFLDECVYQMLADPAVDMSSLKCI